MKRTGVLNILHDTTFPVNRIVINPNTGFDLGFMQVKYVTGLFINTSIESFKNGSAEVFCDADLLLRNECRDATLEISQKLWEKIEKPKKAILIYDEDSNRMMIAGSK